MNIEEYRDYCLAKKGTTEEFPFDEQVLVFKVGGKIYALTNVDNFVSINLKCDPEMAIALREKYPAVQPGYHMNKKHWNTVLLNEGLDDRAVLGLIDFSYDLVVKGLTKKEREKIVNGE